MTPARQAVQRILAGRALQAGDRHSAYAPANIALVKYWGKRDEALNLPVTGSLSISLGPLGSHVELARVEGAVDMVSLNGAPLPADSAFVRRAAAYLDLFRPAPDFRFRSQGAQHGAHGGGVRLVGVGLRRTGQGGGRVVWPGVVDARAVDPGAAG
jgi:hypothetical protein